MTPRAPRDLDLSMARLAAGDRAAFGPVFEQLWPIVQRFCQNYLKNDADAADAAQEALQKIFERCSEYDPARPALPWVITLAGWECRTIVRKRQRLREVADSALEGDVGPSGEDLLAERDLIQAALTALGELSPLDQQALLAAFTDATVDAPAATVRKRRSRALQRLRDTFRRIYGLG